MFKRLKEIFQIKRQSFSLTLQNRRRFDSIHSAGEHNSLNDIYKRLRANDPTLTDKEILKHYYKFSDSIQTNTFAAAELEWVTVSVLCAYRSDLTNELVKRGLLSVVYSIGDNITIDDVVEFIRQRILADNVEPYGGLPPEIGMKWLSHIFPITKDKIRESLEEVIKQNRLELGYL